MQVPNHALCIFDVLLEGFEFEVHVLLVGRYVFSAVTIGNQGLSCAGYATRTCKVKEGKIVGTPGEGHIDIAPLSQDVATTKHKLTDGLSAASVEKVPKILLQRLELRRGRILRHLFVF